MVAPVFNNTTSNDQSLSLNTNFQVFIERMPNVQFFTTDTPLPDMSVNAATVPSPWVDIPIPGDKIDYDPIVVGFNIDANWWSYEEIYDWLNDAANAKTPEAVKDTFTDLYIRVLNNNLDPVMLFKFCNAFPVNVGGVAYNVGGGADEVSAQVQMRYSHIEKVRLDNSRPVKARLPPVEPVPRAPGGGKALPWPMIDPTSGRR